jgi:hypothetical protein
MLEQRGRPQGICWLHIFGREQRRLVGVTMAWPGCLPMGERFDHQRGNQLVPRPAFVLLAFFPCRSCLRPKTPLAYSRTSKSALRALTASGGCALRS